MTKEIRLTQGKVALVDDGDYDWLNQWKWYTRSHKNWIGFYAAMNRRCDGKRYTIRMHRLIMGAQKGQQIDHVNHNGLDNRRANLRFCTQSQNNANSRPQVNKTS